VVTVLKQLTARVRGFLKVRDLDRDLDQELELHLTMLTEENIHCGMGPEEAHRAAVIRVGSLASLKERHRDIRGGSSFIRSSISLTPRTHMQA
jgi:hypothetical protein